MTWLLLGYLAAGILAALRLVPWGERTYFVGRFRSRSWQAQTLGAVCVGGLVVTLWPLYVYCRCREPQLEQIRRRRLELELDYSHRMDLARAVAKIAARDAADA